MWRERVDGLLDHMLAKFFPKQIAVEYVCQNDETNLCVRDRLVFKGTIHRWLANVAQLAPYTSSKIYPVLQASAKGAISQCTGGDNGRMCGFQWATGKYDGKTNVATEMTALSAVLSALSAKANAPPPVTHTTGGTSRGDSSAGAGSGGPKAPPLTPITAASKAAAAFLTLFATLGLVGIQLWMLID